MTHTPITLRAISRSREVWLGRGGDASGAASAASAITPELERLEAGAGRPMRLSPDSARSATTESGREGPRFIPTRPRRARATTVVRGTCGSSCVSPRLACVSAGKSSEEKPGSAGGCSTVAF